MKKLLCFLLCLTLIFSSVSLCFATPVSWDSNDSQHLTEIRNAFVSGGTIYNIINAINSNVVNLNYNLVTLMGWLDPSVGGSTNALLQKILGALTYVVEGSGLGSWLADIWQTNSANLPIINNIYQFESTSIWANPLLINGSIPYIYQFNPTLGSNYFNVNHAAGSQPYNFYMLLRAWMNSSVAYYQNQYNKSLVGYNNSQTYSLWTGNTLSTSTFVPSSQTDGLYKWLSFIQAPVARLSYVLASDERIEAQEAAAANEEAVVDNFIDSSGDGAASPSDIGSVSDLSSGYKQNFGTDASPSGIFDIFNSEHASWFSQETKNQLDTTSPSRMTKSSASETPLLDKQIEDIYDALGVKQP